ncbi:hypothetical protein SAMN04488024_103469 [Pedobacter soli]|uniref:Uncharacterized protein n=2 Tax=Pedobacter soli TaxID=390242 RepID=A0A1G6QVU4_9SPHI|nr:hypothetical protein SAMN04488024_103469 [Pedobacter soli]
MRAYKLKYHKNRVLLIAMAGIPLLFISFLLFFFFKVPALLPESYTLIFVSLYLIIMALIIMWITRTQIFVHCKVSMDENGISFKLKNGSILYRKTDFFSNWENISQVTEMFDNYNGGYFYQIVFNNPNFTANFSPLKNQEEDAERFFSKLRYYQKNYSTISQFPLQTLNSF